MSRFIITISLFLILTLSRGAFACVGARPMAMGGAFIAVSDDANATYWNPAGLDQERERVIKEALDRLEGSQFTYTLTLYNRDEINYDDFVSVIAPLKIKDTDFGVIGLSFISSGFDMPSREITDRWFWLSYGKEIAYGLSLGINLRHQEYKHKVKSGWAVPYPIGWVIGPRESSDEFFAVDPAVFWKLGRFSFGLLYQNINEPEAEIFGRRYRWVRNLRPGIAFRPDDKTTIALDMYDALGETDGRAVDVDHDLRIGIERWFDLPETTPDWLGDSLAMRMGGYHINSERDASRAVTFGLGLKRRPQRLFLYEQRWFEEFELDYCCIYWPDAPPGADKFTHQIGITFKY